LISSYKIQYTRVEGDVYAIALHETSLLSVWCEVSIFISTRVFPATAYQNFTLTTKLDKGLHMLLLFILFFGRKLNIDVAYYNEHIGNDDVTAINGNGNS